MPKVKLFNEEAMLGEAMELFWMKGYHATSIQDLVGHLKLSRSSIYDTYGGKRSLFLKSFKRYRNQHIEGLTAFLAKETNIVDGFRKVFKMAIEQAVCDKDRKGCFVVNTTTEMLPGDPEIQEILENNKNTFVKIFHQFLLKGVRSGEIDKGKDLESIASLFYTLYAGIKVVSKVEPDSKSLMKSVEVVLQMI